jgi:hypothetical protein
VGSLRVVHRRGDEWVAPVLRRGDLEKAGIDYWVDEEWCVFCSSELSKLVQSAEAPVILSRAS